VQRQGEQIERIDDQVPNCDHCIVFFTFFFWLKIDILGGTNSG
jgi:hypothetical protein